MAGAARHWVRQKQPKGKTPGCGASSRSIYAKPVRAKVIWVWQSEMHSSSKACSDRYEPGELEAGRQKKETES